MVPRTTGPSEFRRFFCAEGGTFCESTRSSSDVSMKKREAEEIVQHRQAGEEQDTRQVQVEAHAAASPVKVSNSLRSGMPPG